MGISHLLTRARFQTGLLFVFVAVLPLSTFGTESLDVVTKAFQASSQGLTSGTGKGTYHFYKKKAGEDWKLDTDANIETCFSGKNYRILLTYKREPMRSTSRLILHDDEAITEVRFSPLINPTGSVAYVLPPQSAGDGLVKPQTAGFPWDVSKLLHNVLNVDQLIKNVTAEGIEIKETPDGDLIGSYRVLGSTSHVQFECPQRIGYNISSKKHFIVGDKDPVDQSKLEWKRSPKGLWYVTALECVFRVNDPKLGRTSYREVLRYEEFIPNAAVDREVFMENSIRMPTGSRLIDTRPDAKEEIRRDR